jgi:hypothetical protein
MAWIISIIAYFVDSFVNYAVFPKGWLRGYPAQKNQGW